MLQNIPHNAMIGTRIPWMMKRYESFRTEKFTMNEKTRQNDNMAQTVDMSAVLRWVING